jgi:two-component system response regulator AlgR
MKILVCDDEPLARQRLAALVGDLGAGIVVGEATDGFDCLRQVDALAPDVVLLDVRMPGMDGLEAARHLRRLPRPPSVIFTTAYDDHALAAFEQQALDYLLKPVRSERLAAALERATMIELGRGVLDARSAVNGERRRHVSAFVAGSLRLLPIADIRYFHADGGYVNAVAADTELLIEDPLRALEEEFDDLLVRIHRHTLVAVAHVRALERDGDGNLVVALDGRRERLVVSRRLWSQVRRRLRG